MSEKVCRCSHPLADHCKGKVKHSNYKEDMRMVQSEFRTLNHTCATRHCNQPLCSCTDYQEAEDGIS